MNFRYCSSSITLKSCCKWFYFIRVKGGTKKTKELTGIVIEKCLITYVEEKGVSTWKSFQLIAPLKYHKLINAFISFSFVSYLSKFLEFSSTITYICYFFIDTWIHSKSETHTLSVVSQFLY